MYPAHIQSSSPSSSTPARTQLLLVFRFASTRCGLRSASSGCIHIFPGVLRVSTCTCYVCYLLRARRALVPSPASCGCSSRSRPAQNCRVVMNGRHSVFQRTGGSRTSSRLEFWKVTRLTPCTPLLPHPHRVASTIQSSLQVPSLSRPVRHWHG